MRIGQAFSLALCASVSAIGCEGRIGDPVSPAPTPGEPVPWSAYVPPGESSYTPPPDLPAVALCGQSSLGRGYVSVLGHRREADRLDHAAGVERDLPIINTKWYRWELEQPLLRAFQQNGRDDLGEDGAIGTFNGVRPERQFGRIIMGPMTPVKLYQIAFAHCVSVITTPPSCSMWLDPMFAAAPTEANAPGFCSTIIERTWGRAPAEEELRECVALATSGVAAGEEPKRQWAYVCGAIAASAEFITR